MDIHRGPLSRRAVVAGSVVMVGGLLTRRFGVQRLLAQGDAGPGDGLLIRNHRPLDAEAPLAALRSFLTPNEHFFVRSHLATAPTLPTRWTLTIDGATERASTFTLDQLSALGSVTRPVTLECAGNGRGLFSLPRTTGVQWQYGAVSTAEWTGIPLALLLDRAGLTSDAQHLWMEGIDRAPLPSVPPMQRSIPRAVAMADAFLAWEMNGQPIPIIHGGPLRLLTPGWFGMASTKWLTHIHARPTESDNYFMVTGYRFPDGTPVQHMVVKSVITTPLANQRVPVGRVRVTGQAWTGLGAGGIRAVDVSLDEGRTWLPSRLTGKESQYAWRSWESEVEIRSPGPQRVLARATDRSGATQPRTATANPGGFANNSMHEVRFDAVQS
jgi:sulfite oxidase